MCTTVFGVASELSSLIHRRKENRVGLVHGCKVPRFPRKPDVHSFLESLLKQSVIQPRKPQTLPSQLSILQMNLQRALFLQLGTSYHIRLTVIHHL